MIWNDFWECSVIIWMLPVAITVATGDMFSSSSKMTTAVRIEGILIREAMDYVNKEQLRLAEIRKLLKQIESERGTAALDTKQYLDHPIQSFQLLRRLRRQWNGLKRYIASDKNDKAYFSKVSMLEESTGYPSDSDYADAARIILHLQDTYKLDTSLVADGVISNRQPKSPPLLAEDCFELGVTAWNASTSTYVRRWMAEALTKIRDDDVVYDHYVAETNIMQKLSAALFKEGSVAEALDITNQILQIDPGNTGALERKVIYERKLAEDKHRSDPDEDENSKALCRGDQEYIKKKWNKRRRRRLFCYLTHYGRPRLFISPAKVEILNEKPKVVKYYDILTENEIRILKKNAEPILEASKVASQPGLDVESIHRKSSVAWLDIRTEAGVDRILPRVEDYTGLATSGDYAEYLQVAHYGLGGFYKFHYDDESEGENGGYEGMGKRTATVLFYLSDVAEGGATVFTRAGVRVSPTKRSAVIWYNYLKNGDRDFLSLHAGCPVLMGTKWAANLWILEYGQVFRRKCGLSSDDIY